MSQVDLRFRQIHLDFHTSEAIAGVGAEFDSEEFAATLERARVDSITCFARCHHGWIYFDTQAFPERRHPHLQRNLLKEQIDACHARNIRVPIYITVQWDHYTAERHPEWRVVKPDGRLEGTPPYEAGFYRRLCVNSPYRDFLKAHTAEVLETFSTDGIFFDIVSPMDCSCRYCRAGMAAQGLDPADEGARRAYGVQVINDYMHDMTAFVHGYNPECTIFYNAGHVGTQHRPVVDAYTHFELESLPSGGWGYMHFPVTVRYARTLGVDCLGMTGKFHTSWGDFHSFKNREALRYECFRMLSLGAKCSIGDQLEPLGKISRPVYDLIGSVYAEVEQKERWCAGARPVTEIAVFTPEEFVGGGVGSLPHAVIGATRMLEEGGHQFDIVDSQSELGSYKLLVLPDNIPVDDALAAKVGAFVADGGSLIASYEAGLAPDGGDFTLPLLGVALKGRAPFSPDFLLPHGAIGSGLPETEHVMYLKGLEVAAAPDSEVLAETIVPYFNRTWQHFCSHRHTPSAGEAGYPGIVRNGRAIYFAHPIFTQYHANAPRWCKMLFLNALDLLLPEPVLRHGGPSTTVATLNEQPAHNRQVLHLLHYIPERRSQEIDIVEDVIQIYNVPISVRTSRPVRHVACVPEGEALPYTERDGRVEFEVPTVAGHQMVELQF